MKNPNKPCWLDKIALLICRPWALLLAAAFLLTPSYWLCAALNTGASFLKIDTGARAAAMGGAFTALADDVNALYYNPGGLGLLNRRELGATHSQWLADSQFDFIGFAQPISKGVIGLGVTRLATGGAEGRDANRQVTGKFSAVDTAYSLGYSRALGDGLIGAGRETIGMNVKMIQSQIGPYSASAVAFDLGATHRLDGKPVSLGLAVLNLGQGIKYLDQTDPLPLTVAVGGAYRVAGLFNIAMDVRREVYDQKTDVGVGTEYSLLSTFMLRTGYASQVVQGATGGLTPLGGLSGGFGVRLSNYRADYTFAPFGTLGNAQRISLGARF